jgi:hypothetical protein
MEIPSFVVAFNVVGATDIFVDSYNASRTVANETWLKASAPPDTGRIIVFDSQ